MIEPTEYEKLLKYEEFCIAEIKDVKKLLRQFQYDLKKAKAALVKYNTMSLVHISEKLVLLED